MHYDSSVMDPPRDVICVDTNHPILKSELEEQPEIRQKDSQEETEEAREKIRAIIQKHMGKHHGS